MGSPRDSKRTEECEVQVETEKAKGAVSSNVTKNIERTKPDSSWRCETNDKS